MDSEDRANGLLRTRYGNKRSAAGNSFTKKRLSVSKYFYIRELNRLSYQVNCFSLISLTLMQELV